MMSGIRGKDTKPERIVRAGLHRRGFRFRLHSPAVPGRPDIVLPRWKTAVFVHGCFWHGHDCHLFKEPQTRPEFWGAKIRRNRDRDREVRGLIEQAGWRQLVIWECALKGHSPAERALVLDRAADWIRSGGSFEEIRGD